MARKLRERRSVVTARKTADIVKPACDESNCIAKKDLPRCTPGPCRRRLLENKVDINLPHLRRNDTFYSKWSSNEIEVFEELYKSLSSSRKRCRIFQAIANKLPRKTIGDCVEYYYLFKNIRSFKSTSKEKRRRKQKEKAKQK